MASERVQKRIDRLLDLMEESADKENWLEVQRLARQVLALDPDNIDAPPFLNAAEIEIGKVESLPSKDPSDSTAAELQPFTKPPSDVQPTSFSDGRYQVKRFLGEGGKKKVYLAHDELLDRDIAFALIKSEGLDAISRERITREAQAMGRLGSHPHIVTVLDLGEQNGQPYMVIELLAGGDVEGVVEDAPDHKLPLEQAVRIAIETCRGLEFAHSKGIIHRDLKPGNVWLTGDGTAKIGDFGLAVAIDRSRLTQAGMMVGTVSYMPPEQAMGGEVTPKADLYSLGAMLYEMVAGRPPFLGDDNIAIIGQHINTQAVAPTWHRSDCPRPLEALIMRMLAKNPDERPANAGDVRVALEAIDLSAAKSIEQSVDETHVLDSLAGDVFVGRQAEMGQLKAALEDALSGKGRMVTLVGEPGIGKTRTAQELATYAGLRGCQVLWGRCYEEQGVPPYWPWVQAIRSYVRERTPEELRSEMGSGAADIAEVISDVRAKLPDLESPQQLDSPEQARFRLFDSIAAFLKTASQRKPIVLMLDDLHWSDKPSLMFLEFLTRELANTRLLVVGTYRDVELSRQHPLAETLGELTRQRLFERVLLRGLSQADVSRFIEVSSGITAPLTLARAVYTQTEGNPLFVTEVVRLLVQEGELTQDRVRDRDSWEIRVPEGVREVIGRRLNRLSQRCNETLTVAAVVGREFTLTQLDRLIDDLTSDMVLDVLEEALAARLIEELPTSVGLYQFTHALMQETLINELSLTRRVRLHARIAETLEALYGDDAESHAAELAHHFAQAEAVLGTKKLVFYSLLAGEKSLATQGFEEADIHFGRVLTAKKDQKIDSVTAQALFGRARAQAPTVARPMAQATWDLFERAFDYYVEVGEVRNAITVAQQPLGITDSVRGKASVAARALRLVPDDSRDAGYLLAQYGYSLWFENGDFDGAQAALSRAIEIADNSQELALKARASAYSCMLDSFAGSYHGLADKAIKAIELAESVDDLQAEVRARTVLTRVLYATGHPRESRVSGLRLLEIAEKLQDGQWLMVANKDLGQIAHAVGDWKAAHEYYDRALNVSEWAVTLQGKALAYFEVGDLENGDAIVDRIKAMSKGDSPLSAIALNAALVVMSYRNHITGENVEPLEASSLVIDSTKLDRKDANVVSLLLSRIQHADSSETTPLYEALKRESGFISRSIMVIDRGLGLLAEAIGNLDDSQTHFEDAIAFCRKAGYRPELAWSLGDYADMLLQRGEDGDKEKATAMLDESLAISTELGMQPLMERVLSRREILKA